MVNCFRMMAKLPRFILVLGFLLIVVVLFSKCYRSHEVLSGSGPRGKGYLGSESCKECHSDIYNSYLKTAHFNSTSDPSKTPPLGDFSRSNSFTFSHDLTIRMEKQGRSYYQVVYKNGKEAIRKPFDIVFGFRHAQTSLYWQGDQTFELPISYYKAVDQWATSPGFSATEINYGRLIGRDCYECHTS